MGNENKAEEIAFDLKGVARKIKILSLPGLTEREQDITDWLEMMGEISNEEKRKRLDEIVKQSPDYIPRPHKVSPQIVTIKEFAKQVIHPREIFIESWIEREGLTILGGEQKVGKSIITLNLCAWLTLGRYFLGFYTPEPKNVLLYKQEISEPAMQERVKKMLGNESSNLLDNFYIKNTAGNPIKITNTNDRKRLYDEIEKSNPDLVVFDPLSTFHDKKENDAREMAAVLEHFFEIKHKYKVSILIIHHHGKSTDSVRHGGHLLRGHSIIGDRADSIISFYRLSEKYRNSPLPNGYECYAELNFELRNGAAPSNFIIERNPENLWYRKFDLYDQLGKKILPDKVREIIRESGGELFQSELLKILSESASRGVAFKAISEAKNLDYIEPVKLPGRGNPILLKLKNAGRN